MHETQQQLKQINQLTIRRTGGSFFYQKGHGLSVPKSSICESDNGSL